MKEAECFDHDPDGDNATIVVERNWRYLGSGFLDADQAALALASSELARSHRTRP